MPQIWCFPVLTSRHDAKTFSHQPNRAVTEIVCFPRRTGRNACLAEQGPCDLSVAFATLVSVECAQDQRETLTSLRADGIGRTAARSAHRDTPQTSGSGGPCREICIKGDDD